MHSRWLVVVAMSGPWVGCTSPAAKALNRYKAASLTSEADVKAWAAKTSAPSIYNTASISVELVGMRRGSGEHDPNCPVEQKEGPTTRFIGGCTDKNGVEWFGSLTQEREGEDTGNVRITYEGFGYQRTFTCEDRTGQTKVIFHGTSSETVSASKKAFEIDIRSDRFGLEDGSCGTPASSGAWKYKGTVDALNDDKAVWSGSGRIGYEALGVVEVETKAEVVDGSVCDSEALSGSTTVRSGGHTALIQYDGATDCEDTGTVQWSLDGKATGEVEGVHCSAASGPAFSAWSVALLGALGLMRRRAARVSDDS